jgi:Reverse transcriptase (RNA-dependent DNA polymerase)
VHEPRLKGKPHVIPKRLVWDAWVEGQGQWRSGRGRRREHRAVRGGLEREPLPAVESDVVGVVFPWAGPGGGDTQEGQEGWDQSARHSAGQGHAARQPISPVLANLFLHYGLDAWLVREFPAVAFERFADDAVIHCVSERQARFVRDAVACRLAEVGLEVHPDKTRIVYCKDSNRRGTCEHVSFTFCGYMFRPRKTANKAGG